MERKRWGKEQGWKMERGRTRRKKGGGETPHEGSREGKKGEERKRPERMNGDQRNGNEIGCERAGKEGKETFNETVLHYSLDNSLYNDYITC